MPEPRQRPIPVTSKERAELDRRKELYESATGEPGDWGKALGILTLGGLAALGVYALVKAAQPTSATWQVTCPNSACRATFAVAISGSPARLAQVACPNCQIEMVVDFGSAQKRPPYDLNGHSSLTPGATIYLNCHHCHRQMEVRVVDGEGAGGPSYLRCPFCGSVASYGITQAEFQHNRK